MDPVATVIGLALTRLRQVFAPDASAPPLGGGTDTVYILAGDTGIIPEWVGTNSDSCDDCGPYIWVRLVRRWRTTEFPTESVTADCGAQKAITIEAGIARCHPVDADAAELEQLAAVQWDDAWRIDLALCAAMGDAEAAGRVGRAALGPGEPFGPEGLVIAWTQLAHAEIAGGQQ
ncbi:hypothetical protein [Nocardia cerradoensis]|uniref:Uncharacterized protein n=1 Tax=Nocardia cerradoensis TaxID=85688 RepID=A0A231GTK9_9NOCA|nr:hypothetical protein [Nocardia cerradoensis]NKY48038.1 hypothetical protein [Nocardia cerradoensis]OXR39885.1 hypothetical protein B7C42_08031 [Nocardia cerradoensis]